MRYATIIVVVLSMGCTSLRHRIGVEPSKPGLLFYKNVYGPTCLNEKDLETGTPFKTVLISAWLQGGLKERAVFILNDMYAFKFGESTAFVLQLRLMQGRHTIHFESETQGPIDESIYLYDCK